MQELEKILKDAEIKAIKDIIGENERCYEVCKGSCNEAPEGKCNCRDVLIVNAIKKMEMHMNDGWIPCDQGNIPDREVLCCDKYGGELIGYLRGTEDEWECESEGCIMFDVVAWMEKPKPYKPKVENTERKSSCSE